MSGPPPGGATRPALGLCLAGPTASGKTSLALALAAALAPARQVEIVSVDSALVYRGMDIGTAKPSAAERAAVPHHLIDILDPTEAYSAARFANDARSLAAQIRARGHVPLLVGGTMLYFKALREGMAPLPVATPALRAELDAEAAARGWPALHAELARVDPATAARLAPNDAQRIQRALEVWRSSGRPLSDWLAQAADGSGAVREPDPAADPAAAWPLLSLEPVERGWLHARIAERFASMLAAGLLEEVRALRSRPELHARLPSMRCVGYRQLWEALDRCEEPPHDELLALGLAATRQLAKRQLTWLRSTPGRTVVHADAPDALEQGVAVLRAWAARFGDAEARP